ncbi:MAG: hemerythrin family protein [Rhodobacterales bacterium]|nr:hemerythrin family protein [Rhodobacterales bacterium]
MAQIPWRPEFETGIKDIDYEHRTLIEAINALITDLQGDVSRAQADAFLGEIHALIEGHFALEEQIMRQHGYTDYAPHKADHDHLLEEIRDIMDGVALDAGTALDEALADRLGHWFGNHFRTQDKNLHTLVPHH